MIFNNNYDILSDLYVNKIQIVIDNLKYKTFVVLINNN